MYAMAARFRTAAKSSTQYQLSLAYIAAMNEEEAVDYVFILPHLERLWPVLQGFGFDTRAIATDFQKDYRENGRGYAESNYFLKWGVEKLQPRLNEHLKRPAGYPTFYKIMHDILKDIIAKNDYPPRKRVANSRQDLKGF